MAESTNKNKARARALRAAQVVTMSLALAGAPLVLGGCNESHTPSSDSGTVADTGGSTDTGSGGTDASTCDEWNPQTEDCCNESGGFWDPENGCAIAVPGPFVPPAMV